MIEKSRIKKRLIFWNDSDFFTLFQVNAIPRFILLNPDGTVYDANTSRPSNPDTQKLLDTLLGT